MAVETYEEYDDLDTPVLYIRDEEKSSAVYSVRPHGAFGFFEVAIDRGKVPAKLSSSYTNQEYAEKAVREYLRTKPKSATTKRNENTKAILEQKEK